jgi:hypothetical protein
MNRVKTYGIILNTVWWRAIYLRLYFYIFAIYLAELPAAQKLMHRTEGKSGNTEFKGCGRTRPYPILRYYPCIYLEGLRKIMKTSK